MFCLHTQTEAQSDGDVICLPKVGKQTSVTALNKAKNAAGAPDKRLRGNR